MYFSRKRKTEVFNNISEKYQCVLFSCLLTGLTSNRKNIIVIPHHNFHPICIILRVCAKHFTAGSFEFIRNIRESEFFTSSNIGIIFSRLVISDLKEIHRPGVRKNDRDFSIWEILFRIRDQLRILKRMSSITAEHRKNEQDCSAKAEYMFHNITSESFTLCSIQYSINFYKNQ